MFYSYLIIPPQYSRLYYRVSSIQKNLHVKNSWTILEWQQFYTFSSLFMLHFTKLKHDTTPKRNITDLQEAEVNMSDNIYAKIYEIYFSSWMDLQLFFRCKELESFSYNPKKISTK